MKTMKRFTKEMEALNTSTVTTEAEAYQWLIAFREIYSRLNTADYYAAPSETQPFFHSHFSYLWYLWDMEMNIAGKCYVACYERIQDLQYFEKEYFSQPRVWYNLMEDLSNLEEDTMFLRPERTLSGKEKIDAALRAVTKYFSQRIIPKVDPLHRKDSLGDLFYENQKEDMFRKNYTCAKETIDHILKICDEDEKHSDKIAVLEHIQHMIRNDVKYDCFTDVFYAKEHQASKIGFPIPSTYYLSNGECRGLEKENAPMEIDFSRDCVVAVPWNHRRVVRNASYLKNKEFEFYQTNHL